MYILASDCIDKLPLTIYVNPAVVQATSANNDEIVKNLMALKAMRLLAAGMRPVQVANKIRLLSKKERLTQLAKVPGADAKSREGLKYLLCKVRAMARHTDSFHWQLNDAGNTRAVFLDHVRGLCVCKHGQITSLTARPTMPMRLALTHTTLSIADN